MKVHFSKGVMSKKVNLNPLKNLGSDIPASIVVFLVALPLCLGIASASGAPPFAGLIAGIIGGLVVGFLSGSPLGVSGPAAGLVSIVAFYIVDFGGMTGGGFQIFLVAVVLAGVFQLLMGVFKMGFIAYYFPSSVIHGMLAGIGIKIFITQIPHAFGVDKIAEGDDNAFHTGGGNIFSDLLEPYYYAIPEIMLITGISLTILILWQMPFIAKQKFTKIIPGPFLAVAAGITMVIFYGEADFLSAKEHLVNIPKAESVKGFFGNFTSPDFSALANPKIYLVALMIAFVASIETLLCVEASDKMDEYKRATPTNRELRAQGIGNIFSGLIGGLPITQVIVRSSANQQSGGKTKASTIIHGFLILVSIIAIPGLLNLVPKATLAAILFVVGFKLAKPAMFKRVYNEGWGQFLPFITTIVVMTATDLLSGVSAGLVVAVFIILRNNVKVSHHITKDDKEIMIKLSEDVTFLNKAAIMTTLSEVSDDSVVIIDATKTHFIHHDVLEIFHDFEVNAGFRNIKVVKLDLSDDKQNKPLGRYTVTTTAQLEAETEVKK
ncbi:MAG: MFS superfamily sulfate permease-like transporter [Flavobacteriales bacterium]|jgi:MFS superfamily sulfate permease-like transporter